MSGEQGNRFGWVWVFIAIGVVRMAGSACSGPSTPSRPKQRGGPPLQALKVPTVPAPAPVRVPGRGAAGERPDDWVLLVRFPARAMTPPGARQAPDMDALVERARERVGRAGTMVPALEPPPRAPPRP